MNRNLKNNYTSAIAKIISWKFSEKKSRKLPKQSQIFFWGKLISAIIDTREMIYVPNKAGTKTKDQSSQFWDFVLKK